MYEDELLQEKRMREETFSYFYVTNYVKRSQRAIRAVCFSVSLESWKLASVRVYFYRNQYPRITETPWVSRTTAIRETRISEHEIKLEVIHRVWLQRSEGPYGENNSRTKRKTISRPFCCIKATETLVHFRFSFASFYHLTTISLQARVFCETKDAVKLSIAHRKRGWWVLLL